MVKENKLIKKMKGPSKSVFTIFISSLSITVLIAVVSSIMNMRVVSESSIVVITFLIASFAIYFATYSFNST